jgi:GAF domain-containing protein
MALTRFNVIADMATAISSSTEYDDVLMSVAEQTARAFDVPECLIYEYVEGPGATTATPQALWSADPTPEDLEYIGSPIALFQEPALERVLRDKAMVATTVNDPHLSSADRRAMDEWGELSCLWVPLIFGGRTIGCLELVEKRYPRPFTDYDREFASSLAAMAAISINNARSRRNEAEQERRLTVLLSASLDLALAVGEREILDTIARTTGVALNAEACYIYLYDGGADTIMWVAGWEPEAFMEASDDRVGEVYPLDDYPTDRRVLREGIVLERVASDPQLSERDTAELAEWGFKTILTVPAIAGDEPIAVLEVVEAETERRFTDDEMELALRLGTQAAMVLRARGRQ